MKAKIALATVSGKAYYLLVGELKKKNVLFLSLTPYQEIPADIKVVITTEKERNLISHPNVLVFKEETDPATIVEEAVRIVQGKKAYEKLVVGVDPGKTFGIAVLGDGAILETMNCSDMAEAVNLIKRVIEKEPAERAIVKVGGGALEYTEPFIKMLNNELPKEVELEIVQEAGTSRYMLEQKHRRGLRDVMSAIRIAGRNGQKVERRTDHET